MLSNKQKNKRQKIRTQMQYSLMGNYTDGKWEVIINNIEVLLAEAKEELREKIRENALVLITKWERPCTACDNKKSCINREYEIGKPYCMCKCHIYKSILD